jgi:hypothetical protein
MAFFLPLFWNKTIKIFQNFLAFDRMETDKLAKVTTEMELNGINMAATTGDSDP